MEQQLQRMFELTREEVEASSVERLLLGIAREGEARGGVSHVQGKICFFISGYENDPRELYEIPEVRNYFHKLDALAPFFLFFIASESQGALIRLFVKMFLNDGNFFANGDSTAEDKHLFVSFLASRLNAVSEYCMTVSKKEDVLIDSDSIAFHTMRSCGLDVSPKDVRKLAAC